MNMQYFSTFELRALRSQCMHRVGNKADNLVPRALETMIFLLSLSLSVFFPHTHTQRVTADRSFGKRNEFLKRISIYSAVE